MYVQTLRISDLQPPRMEARWSVYITELIQVHKTSHITAISSGNGSTT